MRTFKTTEMERKVQKSVEQLKLLHQCSEEKLLVDGFVEKKLYSFLNYISSGFELSFMVAVDFTDIPRVKLDPASNGHPNNPSSLHYIDHSGHLNAYHQAVMTVGEVIQFYDSDRRFPVWGFGGKLPNGFVSHYFNLNGSFSDFQVDGVEGIMAAYTSPLQNVNLCGPTLFGQVINKAPSIVGHSLSLHEARMVLLVIYKKP